MYDVCLMMVIGSLMALEIGLYALLNEGLAFLLLQQSAGNAIDCDYDGLVVFLYIKKPTHACVALIIGTRTLSRVAIAAVTWSCFWAIAIGMATVAERSGRSHIVALVVVVIRHLWIYCHR
jgi:hypothetical protein